MDHHGFLTISRQVNTALLNIKGRAMTLPPQWTWVGTPVICPETHCPFCRNVVRSNGIWFFRGAKQEKLIGAIFPGLPGEKVTLIFPDHPHNTGGGILCLGRNLSGIALLASMPNVRDCPMGSYYIPRWLKRYWGRHVCDEGRDWVNAEASDSVRILQELDAI